MCSNGSHEEMICRERGKKLNGISKPLSSSISQNLARISARMDVSGMAQVPMMKFSAPMMKKLPTAARRNKKKFSVHEGGRTGKSRVTIIAVGAVSRIKRNADSPMARASHIHWTDTGLMKSM